MSSQLIAFRNPDAGGFLGEPAKKKGKRPLPDQFLDIGACEKTGKNVLTANGAVKFARERDVSLAEYG